MGTSVYKTSSGKRCVSVTTILDTCLGFSKRVLLAWQAKMFREGKDPDKIKDEACSLGTMVHEAIERTIYGVETGEEELKDATLEEVVVVNRAIDEFKSWMVAENVEVLESEFKVVDDELAVGGTADGLVRINGKTLLLDIKTSKYVMGEYSVQLAGYKYLIERNTDYRIDGAFIVHIDKTLTVDSENGIFSIHTLEQSQIDAGLDIFKCLIEIYRNKNLIEFKKPEKGDEQS